MAVPLAVLRVTETAPSLPPVRVAVIVTVPAFSATEAAATTNTPAPNLILARSAGSAIYGAAQNLVQMDPGTVTNVGGSQPHANMQPFLVLNFIVALQGAFPSRN